MKTNLDLEEHILREQRPIDSLVPPLNYPLELSDTQTKFLLHAIRDVNTNGIDIGEIRRRILDVQRKAFQIYPYPCIHAFKHISLGMSESDAFPHVLKAGQNAKPVLLDIGCCMGTDLRHLVYSGYPSTAVIGCDIRCNFIDLGYELYGDRDTCPISFIVGDVFDITPLPQVDKASVSLDLRDVRHLDELHGRIKFVYAGALFHLFDEGTQEAIARRLATLLDVSEGNGPAVVFGRQVAKADEGVIGDEMCRTRYAHSPASWRKLWERILGEKTRVRVDTEFRSGQILKWNPGHGTEIMYWSVWVG